MGTLLDRVEERAGGPVLRAGGVALAEIERRLEAGEAPDRVAATPGIGAAGLVAALAYLGLGPEGSEALPLVRARPARPSLAAALADEALARLVPGAPRPARLALAAGLRQVHDFWDASHAAAQEADDLGERAVSAYWHGIGHRREPDPGNASYWFRRVGRHPIFGPLGTAARELLAAQRDPAPVEAERLVRGGAWDPFAFIEICRSVPPGSPAERLARRLQRLEMVYLLRPTAEAVGLA